MPHAASATRMQQAVMNRVVVMPSRVDAARPAQQMVGTTNDMDASTTAGWCTGSMVLSEVLAEDNLLVREGVAALLRAAVSEYHRRTRRYGGADVDDVLATG